MVATTHLNPVRARPAERPSEADVWLRTGQRLFNLARALGATPDDALALTRLAVTAALEGDRTAPELTLAERAWPIIDRLRGGPFAALPADERFAYVLVDGAGLAPDAVARLLGLELESVGPRVHRARLALAGS